MTKKIRVFIVDDSAIVREILTENLSRHPQIEVVGSAMDPYIARDKLDSLEVDVITLDIEMPRMDGLTFLRQIMKHYPKPVIVVSSLAQNESPGAMKALEMGAVDVVPKPGGPFSVEEVIDLLTDRILTANTVNPERIFESAERLRTQKKPANATNILASLKTTHQLIAIGASTGGTIALEHLFTQWDPSFPPALAVIHMPEKFTASFAKRLDELSNATVKEAENGERLLQGTVYIAPGNYHMLLRTQGTERSVKIVSGPKVWNQRPAVDPLFSSVAEQVGRNGIGILLTGMGRDGAKGLLEIKNAGGFTVAQDEASSIVWGMPKEAIELGAAEKVLGLDAIVPFLHRKLQ